MKLPVFLGIILFVIISCALTAPAGPGNSRDQVMSYIKRESVRFADYTDHLSIAVDQINPSEPRTLQPVSMALKKCRIQYKKISFFLDYFFPATGKFYNAPAKREVEEPFIEFEEPRGLQQVESILYAPHAEKKKKELQDELTLLKESSRDLGSLYFEFHADTAQIMESLRIEMIRIMALYITGYDAPDLKTGIQESASAIGSFQFIFQLYFTDARSDPKLMKIVRETVACLKTPVDFDHFDRLKFLTDHALPLEEELGNLIKINGWGLNTASHLNYDAGNLFRHEVKQTGQAGTKEMISLGEKLFSDPALSFNDSRSCASCHQPGKYFTDQLRRNRSIDNTKLLARNTPTLLYAGYQSAQFWDGRAVSLTEQINDVLLNKDEMHGSNPVIERKLRGDSLYKTEFHKAYPEANDQTCITIDKMKSALAAYISSLAPMKSAFDKYIKGDHNAMTEEQKKGFNLFMGKAACGSCHFAPLFNGSVPPFYDRIEYEVLGVPASDSGRRKTLDADPGRFLVYPVDVYRRAFKTPTVRNVKHTQPFMHNGCFKSLNEVLDFYNRGGGKGIGLHVPQQTLPAKPLHLSKYEIRAVIAFMNALTDEMR